jgi:hypothetical protein
MHATQDERCVHAVLKPKTGEPVSVSAVGWMVCGCPEFRAVSTP